MNTSKKSVDIIGKILDATYRHNPDALFVMSLMHQYEERGSLSKKQLEGLFQKAQKVKDMPPSWLATLDATIKKMPTRYKSVAEKTMPVLPENKDEELADAILAKYPGHKRVLFFKNKLQHNDPLSQPEQAELSRFHKLLLK
ncbi:hypothetical protein [Sediminibacterium ginsengisoli]|uniref:Uncharacterized protein n=1 Tax=Sediminibacterium ginsengisoli TaxID=413434 RepID=A0A1T4MDA1_9BACT|nr:hypothetical protein [Sediminibacterium ginsengisoli]SJZ64836.1 hypothetical protein SAMN04488132_103320 [Sediminibacterium ginsengisoli]